MSKITIIAFSLTLICIGPCIAAEPIEITFNDLAPEKIEDPFKKLTQKQLQDLAHVVRIRNLISAEKIKPDSTAVIESGLIEKRLTDANVDIEFLLSQRDQVKRLREIQAKEVNEELVSKQVVLSGFIHPLKEEGNKITEFLLVPNIDSCAQAMPPFPNQIVYIKLSTPLSKQGRITAVKVTGTLESKLTKHFLPRKTNQIFSVYALSLESIEIYQKNSQRTQGTNTLVQ